MSRVWRRLRCCLGWHEWIPFGAYVGPSLLVCRVCHAVDVEDHP